MIVFAGPTITSGEVLDVLDAADVRPPARKGDIYKACQSGPKAIGLIDGFFEGVPSVWHKEILWALDQDVPVFGASSMGALRAAELDAFGMIGVGWIYEAFRDGRLQDDDEVALRHGPQELNYVALSEPMVNIRVTLDKATTAGILDHTAASKLCAFAKELYFPDRSWDTLLKRASENGMEETVLADLNAWLVEGRVDQKRVDAIGMLERMATLGAETNPPSKVFEFQHTVMWADLTQACDNGMPSLIVLLLVDSLRHDEDAYRHVRERAVLGVLDGVDHDVPRSVIDQAMTRFRAQNGLYTGVAFNAWLAEKGMSPEAFVEDLKKGLMRSNAIAENPLEFHRALIDVLRGDRDFAPRLKTARSNAEVIQRSGFDMPTPSGIGMHSTALLKWYFEEFRKGAVPSDMDEYLHDNDFVDRLDFEQMMARQYVLCQD